MPGGRASAEPGGGRAAVRPKAASAVQATLSSARLPLQWAGEEKTGPRIARPTFQPSLRRGEPFPKKNGADTVEKAFTIQVTLFIKPELRDEYLAALREFMVLARQEPGCIFLYASEAADEHGTIVVFERFRDPDEFNEILQRDYAQRYLKLSESAYAAPRVIVRLDPIEPLDH